MYCSPGKVLQPYGKILQSWKGITAIRKGIAVLNSDKIKGALKTPFIY